MVPGRNALPQLLEPQGCASCEAMQGRIVENLKELLGVRLDDQIQTELCGATYQFVGSEWWLRAHRAMKAHLARPVEPGAIRGEEPHGALLVRDLGGRRYTALRNWVPWI